MHINENKYLDARQLNAFLDTLTYWERYDFVIDVITRAKVKRQTFFNWKYMLCRIPERAKEIIESVAGQVIFLNVTEDDKDTAASQSRPQL